jgi:hypothetical protein
MQEQLSTLVSYCQENNRVCPMPKQWNELYGLLPNKRQVGAGWIPPLPLILAAWYEPDSQKASRFKEHLKWANEHDAFTEIDKFLRGLPEDQWFHFGD